MRKILRIAERVKPALSIGALTVGLACFGSMLGYFAVQILKPPAKQPDLRITAVAHQWWWEFDYSSLGIKTSNVLYLPSTRTVRIKLSSGDVIHSFWVLGMKDSINIIPGRSQSVDLTLASPGELYGNCDSGCGCGTSCMRFRVLVEAPAAFADWAARERWHPSAFSPPQRATTPSCATNPPRDHRGRGEPDTHLQRLLDNG